MNEWVNKINCNIVKTFLIFIHCRKYVYWHRNKGIKEDNKPLKWIVLPHYYSSHVMNVYVEKKP